MHPPPAAMAPTSRSRTSSGTDTAGGMARFLAPDGWPPGCGRRTAGRRRRRYGEADGAATGRRPTHREEHVDIDEALYTTRAMRRVKPDPIPHEVQAKILDAAVRAPSGGNQQNWRFLLLDDPEKKAALAPLYQHAMGQLWESVYKSQLEAAHADPDTPESQQFFR